jgi:tetratricopeptide (TPR) repeat protein
LLLSYEGRSEEAAAALAEAQRLAPDDPLAHYRFAASGRAPAAHALAREEALRTAIRLAPAFAPARGALARLLLEEGRAFDDALALAAHAVRLDPVSVGYRITALELERRMGCLSLAARDEQELSRVVSRSPDALAALVTHYLSEGSPEKAEAALRRAHAQRPRNLLTIEMMALFLKRHDRWDEAEAVLREGLVTEPDSSMLLNGLAYVNAELGIKLDEALVLVDRALKQSPSSPEIQDTRGWVLFRLGRLHEAEEWVQRSLGAREDPDVREHLGDILSAQGRRGEARAAWQAALDNDHASDEQRSTLKAKIAATEAKQSTQ